MRDVEVGLRVLPVQLPQGLAATLSQPSGSKP